MSSTMPDLAAALGGGAPPPGGGFPPPDVGGPPGLPPDLAAGGAPAPDDGSAGAQPQFANSLDALDAAEEALHAFIQLDPDEADRAIAAQCLQNVIKLKAANQQSAQSGDMKSLARALQGGPGAVGGPAGAGAAAGY
jgi:hypothetical protein